MTAATQRIETAAERYRRIRAGLVEDKIMEPPPSDEPLYDLTTPDGMDWKVRKFKKEVFVAAGMLPTNLSAKIATIGKDAVTPEERKAVFESLPENEQRRAIVFTSQIARYIAVIPRIVETPTSGDEIGYDEVTEGAYAGLVEWAMGGGEADNLDTFRGERREPAEVRNVDAKQRNPRKRVAGNKGRSQGISL